MAKTLTVLRQATRTYLDEATQSDWTDTEVDREINAAYMKTYTAVLDVYEDYYSEKTTIATVASTQEYSLPSNFWKMRRVEINYAPDQSNSTPQRARPISLDTVQTNLGNTTLGITVVRNAAYYIRGTTLGFIPIPTVAGSTAITIWYIKQISELSAAADTIDIPYPDRFYHGIPLEAASVLLRKGQQEEVFSGQYHKDFMMGLERMKQELEDRIADDTKSVVDTAAEDVDFSNYSTI